MYNLEFTLGAALAYDAVWAIALALDKSIKMVSTLFSHLLSFFFVHVCMCAVLLHYCSLSLYHFILPQVASNSNSGCEEYGNLTETDVYENFTYSNRKLWCLLDQNIANSDFVGVSVSKEIPCK